MDLGCSFTGHRQIPDEYKKPLLVLLGRAIAYAYDEGCRRFYTGGALGFDTEAARAVIKFRISHPDVSLILILPCRDQADKWSESARSSYEYTLSVADEVIYVRDSYTPKCMMERNMRLAELGDILISFVSHGQSGAAQTVRMAERLGRRIYNLYPSLKKGEEKQ